MTVRNVLLKIHLYVGLAAALLLVIISATGCALVFEQELDRLLHPGMLTVRPQEKRLPLQEMADLVQKANPARRVIRMQLPQQEGSSHAAMLQDGTMVFINGHTGEILGRRHIQEGFIRGISQLHTALLLKDRKLGSKIVGYSTILFVLLAISGLILWWPLKLVKVKGNAGWRRINFDLHNVSGFYSLVVALIIGVTGIIITFESTIFPLVYGVTGTPPAFAPPKVPLQKGVPTITFDQAYQAAQAALPGARITGLGVWPMAVADLKFPEDKTPAGRSHVFMNLYTGEILEVQSSRTAHPGIKARNINRPLHTGDIWGWPTKIIWFLASLSIVVQAVTGFFIWWYRGR